MKFKKPAIIGIALLGTIALGKVSCDYADSYIRRKAGEAVKETYFSSKYQSPDLSLEYHD
jgi:hypothetical protein